MKWVFFSLFFLISGMYLAASWRNDPRPLRLLKPWLVPPLLAAALFAGCSEWLILTGLILGCLGDILLDMPGEKNFLAGLAAFLLGHILYALWAFARLQAGFALWSLLSLLPVAAACVWLLVRLWSRLGGMKLPVCGYCLVIGLMTGCALCAFFSRPALASAVFALGAMLFLVSDAALALGRFGTPRPHQGFLVMTTYILAQFFISLAPILS